MPKPAPKTKPKPTKRTVKKTPARKPAKPKPTTLPPTSVALELDLTPRRYFADSLNKELRDWVGSEQDLLAKAIELNPHFSATDLLRRGLQYICKREIATTLSRAAAVADAGVAGSADDRLEVALKVCQKIIAENQAKLAKGLPLDRNAFTRLTPWILGSHAEPQVAYRTARRFMELRGLLDTEAPAAKKD